MNQKSPGAPDAQELARHRPRLLKYAMLQLRNTAQAEDAVQETLVAAIRGAETFAGGSAVRTWLIGILKHKIIDSLRKTGREQSLDQYETSADDTDGMFRPDGRYVDRPAGWGDPEEALSRQRLFEVTELCMESLPRKTAQAFSMREIMGLETKEICANLGITTSNRWVLLYRARMKLRECPEKNWIMAGSR